MPVFAFTAAFLCLAVWIIAEVESSRRAVRVGLGFLTMAAVAVSAHSLARFTSAIESGSTRSSLRLAEELLSAGDTQRVQQAIHGYNEVAASGSTYRASFELWHVLNHGPRATNAARPIDLQKRKAKSEGKAIGSLARVV